MNKGKEEFYSASFYCWINLMILWKREREVESQVLIA